LNVDKPEVSFEYRLFGWEVEAADSFPELDVDKMGHGEHCMTPVRPGAKPQPKSILVNFRTIMKLYGHGAI
jgi:hypothetical protein